MTVKTVILDTTDTHILVCVGKGLEVEIPLPDCLVDADFWDVRDYCDNYFEAEGE